MRVLIPGSLPEAKFADEALCGDIHTMIDRVVRGLANGSEVNTAILLALEELLSRVRAIEARIG